MEIPLGYDRTAASLVAARCQAEGLRVRLLTMDENGNAPGITALAEHRLLVHPDDHGRAHEIAQSL